MGRIFVTGASGKIGQGLIASLVAERHRVVGLTRSDAGARRVRGLGGEPWIGDLLDPRALARPLGDVDTVYHLAGGVRGAGHETADVLNREATASLLAAIRMAGTSPRIVFASSGAVYGDRSGLWVDEEMRTFPNTSYGASKVAAEDLLLRAHDETGLDVRIARLAIVYGPGFPILLARERARGQAFLPGEGRNYLPLVHVDDAVQALVAIDRAGRSGRIYNVADKAPRPFEEFYARLGDQDGGRPVRFWSTWVPSAIQLALASRNERWQARLGLHPHGTPDNLRLYTASLRMKVERLTREVAFCLRYPSLEHGVASLARSAGCAGPPAS